MSDAVETLKRVLQIGYPYTLTREQVNAIREVLAENERLRDEIERGELWQKRDEELKAENERLRAQVAMVNHNNDNYTLMRARIEAALALCDSVDRPTGDRLVTIESVRKALRGGDE